jgi:chaperone modulatory protein CbpM
VVEIPIVQGIVLDQESALTLEELAAACAASDEWVVELVQVGVLYAPGGEPAEWRFSGRDLARARRVRKLQSDFEANLELAALVLDFMDEVERLRVRLRRAGFDA